MSASDASLLILTDNPDETLATYRQIRELQYDCAVEKKASESLHQNHHYGLVFYDLGNPSKLDQKILEHLRARNPYLPFVGLSRAQVPIKGEVAPYLNAILRTPAQIDAVKRKIIRYLEPSTPEQCRVDERREVELGFVWSYPKTVSRVHSRTVNLSQGGVFVREEKFSPKRGDILEFILKGDNREVVTGEGIVRWISTRSATTSVQGFGVEFLSKKAPEENLLKVLGL